MRYSLKQLDIQFISSKNAIKLSKYWQSEKHQNTGWRGSRFHSQVLRPFFLSSLFWSILNYILTIILLSKIKFEFDTKSNSPKLYFTHFFRMEPNWNYPFRESATFTFSYMEQNSRDIRLSASCCNLILHIRNCKL